MAGRHFTIWATREAQLGGESVSRNKRQAEDVKGFPQEGRRDPAQLQGHNLQMGSPDKPITT